MVLQNQNLNTNPNTKSNVPLAAQMSGMPNPATSPGGPGPRPAGAPGITTAPTGPSTGTVTGTTQYGPGNNLIGTQINPNPSQRLTDTGNMTQTAAGQYAGTGGGTFKGLTPIDVSGTQGALNAANAQNQSQSVGAYTPVAGTDLSGAKGFMGAAAGQVNPSAAAQGLAGMGSTGSFGYSGDTSGVRGQAVGQLSKMLGSAPDRATLASNTLSRLRADTDAAYQGDLRAVSQKAAAMGRRGSGLTTSDLGDVAQRRNEFLDRRTAELADNAASMTLEDERAKLMAAQGLGDSLAGQDTAAGSLNLGYQNSNNAERGAAFDRTRALGNDAFGRNMDLSNQSARFAGIERGDAMDERDYRARTEDRSNALLRDKAGFARDTARDLYGIDSDQYGRARGERDAEQDFNQQQIGNSRNRFLDMAGYEGDLAGRERSDRNELRGERDFQVGQEDNAFNRRRQQMLDEEALYGQEFSRGRDLFDMGYGATDSYAKDLYGQAGRQDQQGAEQTASGVDLFGEWARSRQNSGGTDPMRDSALASANGYLDSRSRPRLQQTPGSDPYLSGPRGPARRLDIPSF
jgi:hypothetical protein